MQSNLVIPAQARRILFLGGDNVSAKVLSRLLKNEPGNASPISSAKVLRPIITKEQRSNSHSPHHILDTTCRDFNLPCNFVADTKKFKLDDLAVCLGMMSKPAPTPSSSSTSTASSTSSTPASSTCPFSVDEVRGEFLNQFDCAVVASFKYFIPDSIVRAMSPVVNMHPSLLPMYRGAAPLFFPVLRGEKETGASIIKIWPKEGMDCGDILKQGKIVIPDGVDGRTLYPQVLDLGSSLMRDVLEDFGTHWNGAAQQERKNVKWTEDEFHAGKISKEHARIELNNCSGEDVTNMWRAFVGSHYSVPFCDICKVNTPIAPQLKRDDTKKPLKITFNEIIPPCFVRSEAKNEVDQAFSKSSSSSTPGSVYTPNCEPSIAAIRCKNGHFWIKRATLFNSKPQEWSVLATSMLMKSGVVYKDVFVDSVKKEQNGSDNTSSNTIKK